MTILFVYNNIIFIIHLDNVFIILILKNLSETMQENLTEIITVIVRAQPSMLFDVNVAAAGRDFSYPGVTVHADVVGTRDSLTSSIVASADPAGVEFSRRIQDVIASSGLALAVNAYVKSIGAARCSIDYFVA